jgi:DNA-binding transcriptional regulator YdaS (Cro superfamily)
MTAPEKPYLQPLDEAIRLSGGMSGLANKLGLGYRHIQQWRKAGQVPAQWVLKVEDAIEARVTRYEMRPDVFGERTAKVAA